MSVFQEKLTVLLSNLCKVVAQRPLEEKRPSVLKGHNFLLKIPFKECLKNCLSVPLIIQPANFSQTPQ